MANKFEVKSIFKGIDKVTAPIKRMSRSIKNFSNNANTHAAKVRKGFQGLFDLKKNLAGLAIGGVLLTGFTMQARAAVTEIADFEKSIVSASVRFPEGVKRGTEAYKQLEQTAIKTGATTEFTAVQSADALKFYAKAGFTAAQSMAALGPAVDFATAAELDLGLATDISTDALSALGLASKDTVVLKKNLMRVNDVLIKSANKANVDVQQLFETIKKSAPIATALGVSVEQFGALSAVLADSGIKADVAGTSMKNFLVSLAGETPQAAKLLKKLNVQTGDSAGNFRDVVDIIKDLDKGLGKLGTKQRAAALTTIFGRIPLAGVNVFLKKGPAEIRKFQRELEMSGGETEKIASAMRDTLSVQLDVMKSSGTALRRNVLTMFLGAKEMKDVVKSISGGFSLINKHFNLIAAVIGPAFGNVTGLINLLEDVSENLSKRFEIFAKIANIGLFSFGKNTVSEFSKVENKTKAIGDTIKGALGSVKGLPEMFLGKKEDEETKQNEEIGLKTQAKNQDENMRSLEEKVFKNNLNININNKSGANVSIDKSKAPQSLVAVASSG